MSRGRKKGVAWICELKKRYWVLKIKVKGRIHELVAKERYA